MNSFLDQLKKEKILIVGYSSKTGKAVAQYLSNHHISYAISDVKKDDYSVHFLETLNEKPFKVYFGQQTEDQLESINRIIIAPGVPRSIPLLKRAAEKGIPVDSEIALACKLAEGKNIKLIGITGTDGKSTTSALTYYFLKQKYNAYLLGNFGEPFIQQVDNIKDGDYVVLELSSYQMEDGEKYRMNAAAILNIAPDHLNRYANMEEYRKAKEKIFINQTAADFAVLNRDMEFYGHWKSLTKAKIKTVSLKNEADYYYQDGFIYRNKAKWIAVSDIPLKGLHNVENVLTSSAIAESFGVNPELIAASVKDFKGLEHRCEYAGNINGIHFINDSKATTVQAVIRGLSCTQGALILILGGSDKNLDFRELNPYLGKNIKKIICYGETGRKIEQALDFPNKERIYEFDKAFELAVQNAVKEDTVLLSPGCASFDQFTSYEERGRKFKQLVEEYAKKGA